MFFLFLVQPPKEQNVRGTSPLRVVAKEELFGLFERVHSEGGKHLGRDRLFAELKTQYAGFSRDLVMAFAKTCQECQLQKCRKSLKSIVTHPIRTNDFASRGQVDLIDFQGQAINEVNLPYKFLLVYKDHLTKFSVLRPIKTKTAEEVCQVLVEIFCLIGSPHILQSDNGREFKNVNLTNMIRELWPGCKVIHGKPRHPESQGSVERVNREIKKVLGALMRKANDTCWVKFIPQAQYSINTSPHSALENKSPYRVFFGRDPVKGLEDLGIPDEIAEDIRTEEELNIVLEEELTEGLVEPVPAIVESESNYVATFETVQDDLNTSTVYSIDSYMGDIGENQFNSCTNPCIVFDKPCNSFDGVSKSLIPPIFDTLSSQPTLQNDPVYLTRESPENSNISLSIFSSSPQLPLSSTVTPGISKFPDNTELTCVVCHEVCSDAHHCPGCYRAIHAICGEAVDGMEGYGCPVWCVSCLLALS